MKLAPMFTTYLCISTRIIKSLGSSVEASVAEDYYDRILTLPIHIGLSQQDLNHIASVVRGFFSR